MSKATPNVYVNNMFNEGITDDGEDYEDCFSPEDQSDYEDVNPIPKSSHLKTNVIIAHNITNNQSIQDNFRSLMKQVPGRLLLLIICFLITITVSNVVTFITTQNKFSEKKTQHLLCSSLPCLNGGLCVNDEEQYYCSCTRGFSGKNCEVTPCTGFNCLNGGSCDVLNGTFLCLCKSGFTGLFCEEQKPCLSNPCFHSASCTGSDKNNTCYCPIGTEGERCQDEFYEVITSPGYPSNYNNGIYKTWNIDVGVGNTVRIKFSKFVLENGSDFVKIFNAPSTNCCSLGTYTGTNLPSERTSTGRYMTMVFRTDGSVTRPGFRAVIYKKTSN